MVKSKLTNAIGPDARYSDDYINDKSHPFIDDPILLQQYAQILDLKYREANGGDIEALLQNTPPFLDFHLDGTDKYLDGAAGLHYPPPPDLSLDSTGALRGYPDSGYDTLRISMEQQNRPNLCFDITNTNEKSDTKFQDFQLMEKENSKTVLLSIHGKESVDKANNSMSSSSTNSSPTKKTSFSPTKSHEREVAWNKSFQDIRKEKEAPPKNVVKQRLQNFETNKDNSIDGTATTKANTFIEKSPAKAAKAGNNKLRTRSKSVNYNHSSDESDNEQLNAEDKKQERKKSVKDLLSDFEKKSREIHEKEDGYRTLGSYILQDSKDTDRRRVFSDTETLMYETSSEDEHSDNEAQNKPKQNNDQKAASEKQDDKHDEVFAENPPPLPPKKQSLNTEIEIKSLEENLENAMKIDTSDVRKDDEKDTSTENAYLPMAVQEETYLSMTPSKSLTSLSSGGTPALSLTGTPNRKASLTLLSSRTSLSSHGSTQSIHSQGVSKLGSDRNLNSLTPTEALIQSATGGNHSRTPSQSLVMEHLQARVSPFFYCHKFLFTN